MAARKRSSQGQVRKRLGRALKSGYRRSGKLARLVGKRLGRATRTLFTPKRRSTRSQSSEERVDPDIGVERPSLIAAIIGSIQRNDNIWLPAISLLVVLTAVFLAVLPRTPVANRSCVLREQVDFANLQQYWPAVRQWCPIIMQAAERYHHDPHLLAALILAESGGNPTIHSRNGAIGLMQVMPRDGIAAGFQCPGGPCFARRPTIAELEDPAFNVDYGAMLLRANIERTGSVREALRAYGPLYVGYSYADLIIATYDRIRP